MRKIYVLVCLLQLKIFRLHYFLHAGVNLEHIIKTFLLSMPAHYLNVLFTSSDT